MADCRKVARLLERGEDPFLIQAHPDIADHVASCAECQRLLARERALESALRLRPAPPEGLPERAMAAIPGLRRRRPHTPIPALALAGVATAAVLGFIVYAASVRPVGRVVRVFGGQTAEVLQPGSATWQPLKVGDALRRGCIVQTGPAARVAIDLFEGTRLKANVATSLALEGTRRAGLRHGEIWADVAPAPVPLRIETPHALAEVLGTELEVASSLEGTEVVVVRGAVRLESRLEGVTVTAGRKAVCGPDGRIRPPVQVDADLVAAWARIFAASPGEREQRARLRLSADGGLLVTLPWIYTNSQGETTRVAVLPASDLPAIVSIADEENRPLPFLPRQEDSVYLVELGDPLRPGMQAPLGITWKTDAGLAQADGRLVFAVAEDSALSSALGERWRVTLLLPPGAEPVAVDPPPEASGLEDGRPTLEWSGAARPFRCSVEFRPPAH